MKTRRRYAARIRRAPPTSWVDRADAAGISLPTTFRAGLTRLARRTAL
jgi:hypothetical protein